MKRWDICEPRTGGALLHIGALQTGSDEDGTNNKHGGGATTRGAMAGGWNGIGTLLIHSTGG
jgi:hypothetical protein